MSSVQLEGTSPCLPKPGKNGAPRAFVSKQEKPHVSFAYVGHPNQNTLNYFPFSAVRDSGRGVSVEYSYTPRPALRPMRPDFTYWTINGQGRNFSPSDL